MPASDLPWWRENELRLIQTNLRERDATLDVEETVERLDDLAANAWLLNTGGVCAFYPTALEYHRESPSLDGDLIGDAVQTAHEHGIRVVSRFDFSKVDESIAAERPEWLYRGPDGEVVNYHGMVHTCVNGDYQREYAPRILDEVLATYPVDGIFFNMFGYRESDYSGNYHGPCHCENCEQEFRDRYGRDLPPREYDESHPVYSDYRAFQRETAAELLDRVRSLVDDVDRDVAVYTYATHGVDLVAAESNTAIDRPLPRWPYSAVDNCKAIEDTWEEKQAGNICINAVDIPYRFMGVSPHEVALRLHGNLAAGAGLAFCINGTFADYPDQKSLDRVREVYRFHRDNETVFRDLGSLAPVAVVKPGGDSEYRGVFAALAEAHVPFDVIDRRGLLEARGRLADYELVVLPGVGRLDEVSLDTLANLPDSGTSVLATGRALLATGAGRALLPRLFGGEYVETWAETRGAYVEARDEDVFGRLPDTDWVVVDGPFAEVSFDDAESLLPYVTPGTFGPPERVGHEGHEVTDVAGAGVRTFDEAATAYVPWDPGRLYHEHGYREHRDVVLDLVDRVADEPSPISTDAPDRVSIYPAATESGALIQFLNLTGFDGTSYDEPNPIRDVRVEIDGLKPASAVALDERWSVGVDGDTIVLDRLDDYAAVAIET